MLSIATVAAASQRDVAAAQLAMRCGLSCFAVGYLFVDGLVTRSAATLVFAALVLEAIRVACQAPLPHELETIQMIALLVGVIVICVSSAWTIASMRAPKALPAYARADGER
jgi:hypothetical protein